MRLTLSDMSSLTKIYRHPILLSQYRHVNWKNDDYFPNEQQMLIAELYEPDICELPHCSKESFDIFFTVLSLKKINFSECISVISNELLSWVRTYLWKYYNIQDNYFHRILFLLCFVSDNNLDKYINYIPAHNLNIASSNIDNYYSEIRRLLELPPINDDISYLDTPERESNLNNLNEAYESNKYPKWLLYALCHLTNKQLLASKYLYITFVLRKRYHKQKDNDSFPDELSKLFQEDIEDFSYLYENICSRK